MDLKTHGPPPGGSNKQWTPGAKEVGVRVRMYRVGFGDFFLITLVATS